MEGSIEIAASLRQLACVCLSSRHLFLLLGLWIFVGCTTQVDPPSTNSNAFRNINYQLCKDASFDFKNQTPKSLRSLMQCLSGQEELLKPYVDFLNSVPDEDLKVYIASFEQHFNPYLNQAFDILTRMQDKGLLRELSKNISVLVESGVADKGLKLWRKAYENGDGISNEALTFHEFLSELIEQDRLRGALRGWAGLFDNPNAWALAYLLSKDTSDERLSSRRVADAVALAVNQMMESGDFASALVFSSDRQLYDGLKRLSAGDVSEMAHMFDVMMEDSSPTGSLAVFQKIHKELSREVECYSGPKGSRKTLRLDEINAREQIRRRGDKNRLDHLLMVETPFLLAGSVRDCNLPSFVVDSYDHVYKLGARGATPGLATVNYWFFPSGRLNYLARNMRSPSLLSFANVVQFFSLRNATPYKLESVRSLSNEDFNELSSVLTEFAVEDLQSGNINSWIRSRLPKAIQEEALEVLGELKKPKFYQFVDAFISKYPAHEAVLREAMADSKFRRPANEAFQAILKRMLSPELRPELVEFFAAVAESWKSSRGGLGPTLSIMAEASFLAQENPFQHWARSIFQDREFQRKWFSISNRLIQTPEFSEALAFTGRFAQSPEFDGFLRFIIDIFRYSNQKGVQTPPLAGGYQRPPKYEFGAPKPLPPASKQPPSFEFGSCKNIKGSLWDKGGENFYSALKCLGKDQANSGLVKFAELLRQSGDLADYTDILNRHAFNPENANHFLNDLQTLQKSGDLAALMELLIKSRRVGPDALPAFERFFAEYLSQGSAQPAAESLGPVLKSQHLGDAVYSAFDIWEREDDQTFFNSNSNFEMPVTNSADLIKQAKARVPNANDSQIQRALKTFIKRDSNYLHDQQIFEQASQDVIQADIYRMLTLLMRYSREAKTGDLEEFVRGFQEIFEWHRTGKVNLAEFIRWGTSEVKAIPYYVSEEENPQVRFVTPFDQLDLLVANSDFSIAGWLPVFGVDHLGTFFQIELAESKNLAKTLEDLNTLMTRFMGFGKSFIDKTRYNHLRNNLESFSVLQEANRRGHLLILQRLYQAFYRATPPSLRREQDPEKNHMSLIHQTTRWAMFSRLVAPMRHVEMSGQLEHFTGVLGQLLKSLNAEDEPVVRAAFDNLLARHSGNPSAVDQILTLVFQTSNNPVVFDNLKDQLYHLLFAIGRNVSRGRPLFEVLSEVRPPLVGRILDRYNRRLLSDTKTSDLKLISRFASLNPESTKLFRAWLNEVSSNSGRGRTVIGEVLDPLLDVINANDRELMAFLDALQMLLKHPEVKQRNLKVTVRRILNEYQTVKRILPQILAQPNDRRTMMEITLRMARERQMEALTDAFIQIYESGQLTDLLTLINDYAVYKPR